MARHNFSALLLHYPDVIAEMPSQFKSHEFILRLAQKNQRDYVEALFAYRTNDEPFRSVHRQLSAKLNNYPHLVEKLRPTGSWDIFGHANTCMSWRKRV